MDEETRLDSGFADALHGRNLRFPAGSVVAVVGPPEAPTDGLLARAAAARPTTYYSTKRTPEWVGDTLLATVDTPLDVEVVGVCHAHGAPAVHVERDDAGAVTESPVDGVSSTAVEHDRFDELSEKLLSRAGDAPAGIVIDDFTDFADETRQCLQLMDTVRQAVPQGIAWLRVIHPSAEHPGAESVIAAADGVCWLEHGPDDAHRLVVTRRRGDSPVTDPVTLDL